MKKLSFLNSYFFMLFVLCLFAACTVENQAQIPALEVGSETVISPSGEKVEVIFK